MAPAIVLSVMISALGQRNLWANGIEHLTGLFSPRLPAEEHLPAECRNCGGALTVGTKKQVEICIYCRTENFIVINRKRIQELQKNVKNMRLVLEDVVQLLRIRRRWGMIIGVGRGVSIGLMLLPFFFFSLDTGGWNNGLWALLIVIDTWFLGICTYWMLREALLPPVDSSDWMPAGLTRNRQKSGNGETRGWFDSAFEKQNYVVSLIPVALYIAIQVVALIKS